MTQKRLNAKDIKNIWGHAGFVRSVLPLLVWACMLGMLGVASPAEAAAKKGCSNYVKHNHHSKCISAKHARYHGRHVVMARPQPASFVMDADTGKVLAAENADAQRYPASLTKMMTLYLTFDALKKGKLKLDSTVPVSAHASVQPQTNIALQPGDRLAVKDAILAIVVRSANDAAVTLGEAIGGSEEEFARKMTEKARALGMKNTVFFNASGLPEPRQHTTARDMAILGLALRRDFPQYFPFFKTESFSYNGVTYPTHNHVMMRYDGVDGIKTGYIRASGFNLVTSAKRDNHNLIGVVLGGTSWRARDDKMIALLDQSFTRMAKNYTGAPATLVARAEPVAAEAAAINPTIAEDEATEGQGDLNSEDSAESDVEAGMPTGAFAAIANADAAPTKATTATALNLARDWGIQVGAYARKSDAVNAATRAMKQAPSLLASSKISVSDKKGGAHYRARLINLSEPDAEAACSELATKKLACFTFRN